MPNNIAGFRAKYKIPQRVLADLLNIKLPTYCNKENNVKAEFTRSEMIAMGEYFGKCLKLAGLNVAVI